MRLAEGEAPVDVVIADGRVASIATHGSVRPSGAIPNGDIVEAEERLLLPGLWDEHVHMTQWALTAARVQLSGAHSAAEALALVADALARPGVARPLVGVGFRDGVWPDAPSRASLDAVSGDHPVVLQSHDIHCAWLNTAAAALLGIAVRPSADGSLNGAIDDSGLLREGPAFAVAQRVNRMSAEHQDAAVTAAVRAAAAAGVVGAVDFEMAWNPGEWGRRVSQGLDPLRIEAAVYPDSLDRAEDEGLRTGDIVHGTGGLVTVGPLKVLIDGALNTRTAYCVDPYPDGTRGLLTVQPQALAALLRRGARAGFRPAVHAIGDAAITVALDALESTGLHGRIEHAQLVADADLPRFTALGVTASVQPAHLLDDRDVAERHWPGRTGRAYPFSALLDAGAPLAFGSDAPVAPLDPWLAIRAAVTRAAGDEPAWHPEHRIPVAAALAAATRGRTRVRVGDPADLVLIEEPVERMHASGVAATMLGGRFTHRRI
ncbi:amidohydrolase [uncultured Amnibacterium sp.]|uniref:amidohydrolase n=1 Tax=uncultured Amnibacterium sp. TaxID=1631851 RepID=UPI0035CB1DD7